MPELNVLVKFNLGHLLGHLFLSTSLNIGWNRLSFGHSLLQGRHDASRPHRPMVSRCEPQPDESGFLVVAADASLRSEARWEHDLADGDVDETRRSIPGVAPSFKDLSRRLDAAAHS